MSRGSGGLRRRDLLAAGGALAALGPVQAAPGATSDVLQVAAFPLVDQIIQAALPQWQQRHPGVNIQLLSRQYADHHTAMTTALSTKVLLSDVMVLESSFVGRYAQGQGLEDLARPPYDIGRFRDRLVPYAYDQAIGRGGAVLAMPTDIGPGTLLYRDDILARADVVPEALTASWDSYITAGERIRAKTGAYLIAHVQSIKDILIRHGVNAGDSLYYSAAGEVLVQTPRFVRAFEIAREVRRRRLKARVAAWSNDWAEGFRRGTLATELSGAWLVGQLSNWVGPQTRGLWRAAALPGGAQVSYGGSFYAMPRRAAPRRAAPERKVLAWDFIQMMTLDRQRQLAAFKTHDGFPALLETHDDAFFEQPVSFLGGQPARLLWRDAARRITATRVHKQNGFADEVVGTELDKVLDRGKSIAQALGDASRLLARRAHR